MKTIPLTQGKFAIVDDELFDELSRFKWSAMQSHKTFYAIRISTVDGKRLSILMHREVMRLLGEPASDTVDHIDRNGLNNVRANLRHATYAEQNRNQARRTKNSSGYIGVCRDGKRWKARIRVEYQQISLGTFNDPFSAAWVRDEAAKRYHGQYASLNNLTDRRATPRT